MFYIFKETFPQWLGETQMMTRPEEVLDVSLTYNYLIRFLSWEVVLSWSCGISISASKSWYLAKYSRRSLWRPSELFLLVDPSPWVFSPQILASLTFLNSVLCLSNSTTLLNSICVPSLHYNPGIMCWQKNLCEDKAYLFLFPPFSSVIPVILFNV